MRGDGGTYAATTGAEFANDGVITREYSVRKLDDYQEYIELCRLTTGLMPN